jgi:hypothetical protein
MYLYLEKKNPNTIHETIIVYRIENKKYVFDMVIPSNRSNMYLLYLFLKDNYCEDIVITFDYEEDIELCDYQKNELILNEFFY